MAATSPSFPTFDQPKAIRRSTTIDKLRSTVGMDPELADGPESAAAALMTVRAAALAETLTRPIADSAFSTRVVPERKALRSDAHGRHHFSVKLNVEALSPTGVGVAMNSRSVLGGWHLDRQPGDHGCGSGSSHTAGPTGPLHRRPRPLPPPPSANPPSRPDDRGCGGRSPTCPDDGAG